MESAEISEGMQRLIGARRGIDELLADLPGGETGQAPEARLESESPKSGSRAEWGAGREWELLSLERRLAALEERAERAVGHLEAQAKIAEERLNARLQAAAEDAMTRIETAVGAAELRLAAVDAAQEREERVRERIEEARRAAEERVREAERRLVEVLNRVDSASS